MKYSWQRPALIGAGALLLGIFLLHSIALPWLRDEGLYLIAARELQRGLLPHLDFFYEQMPLYVPLLAGWGAAFGGGLLSARLLSLLNVALLLWGSWIYLGRFRVSPVVRTACLATLLIHPLSWVCLPLFSSRRPRSDPGG